VWPFFSGGKPTSSEFLPPSIYLLAFRFVRLFFGGVPCPFAIVFSSRKATVFEKEKGETSFGFVLFRYQLPFSFWEFRILAYKNLVFKKRKNIIRFIFILLKKIINNPFG